MVAPHGHVVALQLPSQERLDVVVTVFDGPTAESPILRAADGRVWSSGRNLRLVLELNAVSREKSEQRMLNLLDAVGLADRMGSYPDILSGGERQRVAIARALCHQPSLILADEPTGNLDDRTAQDVLDLLDKLVRQAGRTMIVATHSTSVADYCDQVLELHDGRLGPAQAGLS